VGAGLRLVALGIDILVVAHVNGGLAGPARHKGCVNARYVFCNATYCSRAPGAGTYRSREKVSCATQPARGLLRHNCLLVP
jgi:hypothetical protein